MQGGAMVEFNVNVSGKERIDLTAGFGVIVRDLRKKKGLTQTELGDAVGLVVNSINRIETGGQKLDTWRLTKIMKALGVTMTISFDDQ
jgi:transcriptional regulator with XRE-family HTH domain